MNQMNTESAIIFPKEVEMPKSACSTRLVVLVTLIMLSCQSGQPPAEDTTQTKGSKGSSPQDKDAGAKFVKKFFQTKSAKIDFVYSGIFEGKETFYFDDWGNTVVIVEDKTEFGNPVKQTVIWMDEQATIYKDDEKTLWQGRMRPKGTEPPAVAGIAESQLSLVGYQRMPDEEIAGKRCTVYENSGLNVKYWLWQGIDLKIINRSVGKAGYVREAVSVVENAGIPEDLLAIPEEYGEEE